MMFSRLIPFVLAACLVVPGVVIPLADSQGKPRTPQRRMTVEDVIRLQFPSALTVSPTGNYLAFVVSGRELETNAAWSKVMLMDLATGNVSRITAGGTREHSPSFHPQGTRLLFVSNVENPPQAFQADLPTEPPSKVTHLSTGASAPRFTPDGSRIVFLSSVYPECTFDECNRLKIEEEKNNPVTAKIFDRLMYRHWDHWRDGRVNHLYTIDPVTSITQPLMNRDTWGVTGPWAISPDGRFATYTTKNPEKEELSTNNDLYEIPLDGSAGEPRQVTTNPAWDSTPEYSPDGQWLLYLSQERPGFEADLFRLTLLPAFGGSPRIPAENLDNWVSAHGWFPDSQSVWLLVAEQGRQVLYTMSVDGSGLTPRIQGATLSNVTLGPDGKTFYYVRQTLSSPPEIWTASADGTGAKALTRLNQWMVEDVAMATVEEVWWEGAGGTKVHGFVLFPPGTSKDRKNPFVMLIHGGPQGAWEDSFHPRWNAQLFAAPGYVTLVPNPRGSSGYGQLFVDQVSRDWGGRVYQDLMTGVDFLIQKGWVDPARMCAGGGSFGGYMANWILGNTDRFRCLFTHAGVYDLGSKYGVTEELWFPEWEFGGPPWESDDYQKWSPSNRVKNFKTPMLVIHGAHDFRVPEDQAMQLFTTLQRLGVPSRFLYFPDETHFVVKPRNTQLWYNTVHEWLNQWLNKELSR